MHENPVHAILLGHLQQSVEMGLLRMHATVREQAEQMQSPFAQARMFHCRKQDWMRKEFTIPDHQVDASDIHVHDAPGANVEVPNFAVAHLPLGQSNKRPAGMDQRVGILAHYTVVSRLARQGDGVGFGLGPISPAVKNDENKWFWSRHKRGFQLLPASFWVLG